MKISAPSKIIIIIMIIIATVFEIESFYQLLASRGCDKYLRREGTLWAGVVRKCGDGGPSSLPPPAPRRGDAAAGRVEGAEVRGNLGFPGLSRSG